MAEVLSENVPRAVSVVAVDIAAVDNIRSDVNRTQETTRDNVRSFTSTEAQTELALHGGPEASQNEEIPDGIRDARRRERRLRRQHRRALRSCSIPTTYPGTAPGCQAVSTALGVPLVPPPRGFLHPPPPHLGLRGLSLGLPFPVPASVSAFGRDAVPKQCCGLSSPPVRWSILGVGFVGLVCAGAGTLLGALKASGRDHLVGIFMSEKECGRETHRCFIYKFLKFTGKKSLWANEFMWRQSLARDRRRGKLEFATVTF